MAHRHTNIVDFTEFRAARAARQLDLLDAATEPPAGEAPRRERRLSAREVEHRARMLAHCEHTRASGWDAP